MATRTAKARKRFRRRSARRLRARETAMMVNQFWQDRKIMVGLALSDELEAAERDRSFREQYAREYYEWVDAMEEEFDNEWNDGVDGDGVFSDEDELNIQAALCGEEMQ